MHPRLEASHAQALRQLFFERQVTPRGADAGLWAAYRAAVEHKVDVTGHDVGSNNTGPQVMQEAGAAADFDGRVGAVLRRDAVHVFEEQAIPEAITAFDSGF